MPATGTQFGSREVTQSGDDVQGLGSYWNEGVALGAPGPDSCRFQRWTGTPAMPDITATSGTTLLVASSASVVGVPKGMRCYGTGIAIEVLTAFSGGTPSNVSLSIQDTFGNVIMTITGAALTAGAYIAFPANALPTGVVNGLTGPLTGAWTAKDQGIRIVASNSTAGVARIRLNGQYAP